MKKHIALLSIIILFVSAPCVMAKSLENQLIGTWSAPIPKGAPFVGSMQIRFAQNQSYLLNLDLDINYNNKPAHFQYTAIGTWAVSGNMVTMKAESASTVDWPVLSPGSITILLPGQSDYLTITNLDSRTLSVVFSDDDGNHFPLTVFRQS